MSPCSDYLSDNDANIILYILCAFSVPGIVLNSLAIASISPQRTLLHKHLASLTLFAFNFLQSFMIIVVVVIGPPIKSGKVSQFMAFLYKVCTLGQLFALMLIVVEKYYLLRWSLRDVNRVRRNPERRNPFHIITFLVGMTTVANVILTSYLVSLRDVIYVICGVTCIMYVFLLVNVHTLTRKSSVRGSLSRRRALIYVSTLFVIYLFNSLSQGISGSVWHENWKLNCTPQFNTINKLLYATNLVHLVTDPLLFYICYTTARGKCKKYLNNFVSKLSSLYMCYQGQPKDKSKLIGGGKGERNLLIVSSVLPGMFMIKPNQPVLV